MKLRKYKLKKLLAQFLKFIAKIFLEQLAKIMIYGVIGLGVLSLISVSVRDFLLEILQLSITELPKELLVYHLLLTIIALLILIYLFFLIKKKVSRKFYFINDQFFKWRVDKENSFVKKEPFCRDHEIPLTYRSSRSPLVIDNQFLSFTCPIDKKVIIKNMPFETYQDCYETAKNKAEAKLNKYGKGF